MTVERRDMVYRGNVAKLPAVQVNGILLVIETANVRVDSRSDGDDFRAESARRFRRDERLESSLRRFPVYRVGVLGRLEFPANRTIRHTGLFGPLHRIKYDSSVIVSLAPELAHPLPRFKPDPMVKIAVRPRTEKARKRDAAGVDRIAAIGAGHGV